MPERVGFSPGHKNKLKTTLKPLLIGRIKLAALMELDEKTFRERAKSIENDPLFHKLFRPENRSERSITYSRPYRLKLSDTFLELKDELVTGGGELDVQSLVSYRENAARLIKQIGEENFKTHFLFNEGGIDAAETAAALGISASGVKSILELVDELEARGEFYCGSSLAPEKSIAYNKIAAIERGPENRLNIAYLSIFLAKGRYSIDYDKIKAQKKLGVFTKDEASRVDALVQELELINLKKVTIHKVIENILEFQKEFIESEDKAMLAPLSQKTVSKRLEVSPSLVNRAICARSVALPSGRETALKEFFPSKKDVVKIVLKKILNSEKKVLKDEELKDIILNKYGFGISRHLVQIYRSELGIAPANKRASNRQS